jgi:hypothetical protein
MAMLSTYHCPVLPIYYYLFFSFHVPYGSMFCLSFVCSMRYGSIMNVIFFHQGRGPEKSIFLLWTESSSLYTWNL